MAEQLPLKIGSTGLPTTFANSDTVPTDNLNAATQAEAEAGIVTDKVMTPLRTAQAISALAPGGSGGVTHGQAIAYAIVFGG